MRAVLGLANNFQDNYFQGQINILSTTYHLMFNCGQTSKNLLSSARLKSYPKERETKRVELKLIEKIRIPLEKSNFIPSNFAKDVINNDHLQLHPSRKSQSMSFESFIIQGIPIQDVTVLSCIIRARLFKGWITLFTG